MGKRSLALPASTGEHVDEIHMSEWPDQIADPAEHIAPIVRPHPVDDQTTRAP